MGETAELFPSIEPFDTFRLDVGDGHHLYVEQSGNPNGQPALLLHGGPGAGSNPTMRRFHDPARYRIILFDQRGCGRSGPFASLANNTTWHLVEDIERIRRHLGIERWQLFGGSWGSALALAYAETHPERVTSLVLRGVFLVRRAELDWFYQSGCNWLFPEAYAAFVKPIPQAERGDVIAAYYRRLTVPDQAAQLEAARSWSLWEASTVSIVEDTQRLRLIPASPSILAFARIEAHYFVNRGFFAADGELLAKAYKLDGIPGIIVHGRYDVVTPVRNAWELAAAWPGSQLKIVSDAGHAMTEPGIARELIAATRAFADRMAS
ncbi:MAG: prolyl aminopeptidase [Hyphomicrobiaceae bacterium]|nr:prolyl aminopeptidase [Hyphomicrobiaceae bacterium]